MPPRFQNIGYMNIQFKDDEQRKWFEVLSQCEILSTRYVDNKCLRNLGLYDYVHWMFYQVGCSHFVTLRHRTYERLTFVFLNSFD